jgi:hypothetical protein
MMLERGVFYLPDSSPSRLALAVIAFKANFIALRNGVLKMKGMQKAYREIRER